MNKIEAIKAAKQFRVDADALLQRMKAHTKELIVHGRTIVAGDDEVTEQQLADSREIVAQHIISTRDLESAIMRQGMVLKCIGTPNPYPDSYKPENTIVNPTADGLKL